MENNTLNRTISLYSIIITIVAAVLFTLLLRQCEPALMDNDLKRVVDSFKMNEQKTEDGIQSIKDSLILKDSAIKQLTISKNKTKIVYKEVEKKIKETITVGCDSLKAQVTTLMELADDYQLQTDSIIEDYRDIINKKDSILLLRENLYRDLRNSFGISIKAYQDKTLQYIQARKIIKRDRFLMGGIAIIAGILILKK